MKEQPAYVPAYVPASWNSCIYFIHAPKVRMIKIGRSLTRGAVDKRLLKLQTASPVQLVLLAVIPDVPGYTEQELHLRFKKHRSHGEWFRARVDILRFAEQHAVLSGTDGAAAAGGRRSGARSAGPASTRRPSR